MADKRVEALKQDMDQFRKELSELTSSVSEAAAERGSQAYDAARKRAVASERRARTTLQEHPWSSAAATLVIGVILGLLLGRRV